MQSSSFPRDRKAGEPIHLKLRHGSRSLGGIASGSFLGGHVAHGSDTGSLIGGGRSFLAQSDAVVQGCDLGNILNVTVFVFLQMLHRQGGQINAGIHNRLGQLDAHSHRLDRLHFLAGGLIGECDVQRSKTVVLYFRCIQLVRNGIQLILSSQHGNAQLGLYALRKSTFRRSNDDVHRFAIGLQRSGIFHAAVRFLVFSDIGHRVLGRRGSGIGLCRSFRFRRRLRLFFGYIRRRRRLGRGRGAFRFSGSLVLAGCAAGGCRLVLRLGFRFHRRDCLRRSGRRIAGRLVLRKGRARQT